MAADTKLIDEQTREAQGGRGEAAPLSVLVVSPDRRFRSVTTVLIARRGSAVATTAHADRIAELAGRLRADVVVIDLDEGSPTSAAAVQAARSLPHVRGVVLVDEEETGDAGLGAPAHVHCKWGPFPDLYAAIQAAA